MTDHNDTGATARPWREALRREPERYAACSPEAISHGSQAQMKYFVADAQHDIAILATRLAEVERERDDFKERLAVADASLVLETGAGIDTHETMLRVSKQWCARAHAAEARVAVLEKALRVIWNSIPGFEVDGSYLTTRVDAQHWWEVVAPAVATALKQT